MKTYRFVYRLGPKEHGLKEIQISAPSMIVAFDKINEQLRLKYPHYELHSVHEAPSLFSTDPEEMYREVEVRR